MKSDLYDIICLLRKFRDERGWNKFHDPKNLAISVSVEAAELLEIFQWSDELGPLDVRDVERVADEAADVMIYTLMLFDKLGLDPITEVRKKIKINDDRFPPSKVYGKARMDQP